MNIEAILTDDERAQLQSAARLHGLQTLYLCKITKTVLDRNQFSTEEGREVGRQLIDLSKRMIADEAAVLEACMNIMLLPPDDEFWRELHAGMYDKTPEEARRVQELQEAISPLLDELMSLFVAPETTGATA